MASIGSSFLNLSHIVIPIFSLQPSEKRLLKWSGNSKKIYITVRLLGVFSQYNKHLLPREELI